MGESKKFYRVVRDSEERFYFGSRGKVVCLEVLENLSCFWGFSCLGRLDF